VLFEFEQYDWPFVQAPPSSRSRALKQYRNECVHTAHSSCSEQKDLPINQLAELIIFLRKVIYKMNCEHTSKMLATVDCLQKECSKKTL
jgi:hypothetical protein